MSYGLYISAEGAQAQSQRLDVISNNLANVDTVGFKRDLAMFQARNAEAIDQGKAIAGSGSIDNIGGGVTFKGSRTDYSPGPLKATGNPSDVAMRRPGFFQVRDGKETYLTRAGNFTMTARGELVTQDGLPVLSESGSPITLENPQMPWEITAAGDLRQGSNTQRLAIVKPASMGDLVKVGGNKFRALADISPVAATDRDVASGHLEMSGVEPTSEMVEMIQTSRYLEANLNMMQTQDRMLNELFSQFLKA
jgi:flagellar basal-body rod protein FlgF/flagellar basal-body rod protein FlgG